MTSKDQVLIEPSRITSDFTVVTVEGGYAIKISPDFSFSWETADETDDITSLDAKEIFVTDKNQPVYLTTTKGNTIKHSDPKVIQHILSELRYEYSIDYFDNRTSVMWEVPMDFPSLNLLSVYSDHEGNFKQLINEWSVDTIKEKLAYDQYFNSHTYNLDFFNVSEISDDHSIRFMPAFTAYPDDIENDFIHFQLHLPVTKYLINLLQEDDEVNLKKAWDNGQDKLESIGSWFSLLTGSNIDPPEEWPEEWHDVVINLCSVISQEINLLSNHRRLALQELCFMDNFLSSLALLRDVITPLEYAKIFYHAYDTGDAEIKFRNEFNERLFAATSVMTYLNLVDPYSSVKNLIEAGESEKLEFKSSLRFSLHKGIYDKELTHEVLKTIAGFLNTNGGTLLIGIGDGGEVIGIKKDGLKNNDKYLLHLTGLFNKYIGKEATTNIKTRIETYLGKRICIVECKESEIPVYLDNISNKKEVEIYFVRTGPSTVRLGTKQAVEHIRNKTTRNQP